MDRGNKVRPLVVRYAVFMLGMAVMSFGVVMTIQADMGVASWDVLHIGLYKTFGLTIGTWSQMTGFMVIVLSYMIARIKPGIGTILNMVFVGAFIDLFMWLDWIPQAVLIVEKLALFLAGLCVFSCGLGLYISPRIGAGPRDSLMLAFKERLGWSIQRSRLTMEIVVLSAGWLLGGPVSVGTLLAALLTGPLIQRTIPFWEKSLQKPFGFQTKEQWHA